jgi:hypothetical protein
MNVQTFLYRYRSLKKPLMVALYYVRSDFDEARVMSKLPQQLVIQGGV